MPEVPSPVQEPRQQPGTAKLKVHPTARPENSQRLDEIAFLGRCGGHVLQGDVGEHSVYACVRNWQLSLPGNLEILNIFQPGEIRARPIKHHSTDIHGDHPSREGGKLSRHPPDSGADLQQRVFVCQRHTASRQKLVYLANAGCKELLGFA
ncbi:hypothetical protein GCM10027052_02620 [Parafrigoribacterium mesophilum]